MLRTVFFLMLMASPSVAATINLVSNSEPTYQTTLLNPICNITLEGPIEAGDANTLEQVVDENFVWIGEPDSQIVLCLKSRGGSWDEALTMGEFLNMRGLMTRVQANDDCLSACAILFLFGTATTANERFNGRIIDFGARIGFHAPSLNLSSTIQSEALLALAYSQALGDLGRLVRLASAPSGRFETALTDGLFINMLDYSGPDSFYRIETMAQIAEYDFQPSFVDLPPDYWISDSEEVLLNVCEFAWHQDNPPAIVFQRDLDIQFGTSNNGSFGFPGTEPGWQAVVANGMRQIGCHIRGREYDSVSGTYPRGPFVDVRLYGDNILFADTIVPVHAAAYPWYNFSGWSD